MAGIGGFARNGDGLTIGRAAAEAAWLPAAGEVLREVAGTAYGVITQADFAAAIQQRTGVRANPALAKWLGPFLARAAAECRALGRPPLVALVVEADSGRVGPAYDGVATALGLPEPAGAREREKLAAEHRIECYRWAGAPEPAGGWYARVAGSTGRGTAPRRAAAGPRSASSPRATGTRTAARRASADEAAPATCPRCFMQLPATGVCDDCG